MAGIVENTYGATIFARHSQEQKLKPTEFLERNFSCSLSVYLHQPYQQVCENFSSSL